ncbi:MAG: DUF494 family protein [Neisseriaceae bacterium]
MFDVFVFLFEQFQTLGHFPSRHDICEKLDEAGFDDEDITTALKCFDAFFNESSSNMPVCRYAEQSSSFRIFSKDEILLLSKEIRGYLHFLYRKEIISGHEIEMIIQFISKVKPEELTLETVKVLTLIIAWVNQSEVPVLLADDLLNSLYEKQLVH